MPGFKKGKHILEGDVIAEVVCRRQDIPAAFAHLLDTQTDFTADILNCPVVEHILDIHAALEGKILSEIALQLNRVHPAQMPFDWIENIESGLDQVRDELSDCAVIVKKH